MLTSFSSNQPPGCRILKCSFNVYEGKISYYLQAIYISYSVPVISFQGNCNEALVYELERIIRKRQWFAKFSHAKFDVCWYVGLWKHGIEINSVEHRSWISLGHLTCPYSGSLICVRLVSTPYVLRGC